MSSAIPIRNSGDQGIPMQFHRESFAHSQGMGGISWGGASVGSWLRDEVLMATRENTNKEFNNQIGNSAFSLGAADTLGDQAHNNVGPTSQSHQNQTLMSQFAGSPDQHAYFPSIEAKFCKDYSCCGDTLPTLHDLLRHYEEQHISPSPPDEAPVMRRVQNIETVSTNDVFMPFERSGQNQDPLGLGTAGMDLDDLDLGLGTNTSHPFAPPSFQPLTQNILAQGVGGKQMNARFNQSGNSNGNSNMSGHRGHSNIQESGNGLGLSRNGFGSNNSYGNVSDAGLNNGINANMHTGVGMGVLGQNGIQGMQAANNPGHNVNTGMGGSNQFRSGIGPNNVLGDLSNAGLLGASAMNVARGGPVLNLGDDDEPTIDDPARQLYMLERTENKPFKCPVIGCEKTYKNQNGLKYHRQHGHQNQTLHLNDDGTYSIIDPLSNTPYPDGMGMEKDKPYRCEICGKRYKNLNGLKYHRAHSTH